MAKYSRLDLLSFSTDHPGSKKVIDINEDNFVTFENADKTQSASFIPDIHSIDLSEKVEVPLLSLEYLGKKVQELPARVKRNIIRAATPENSEKLLNGTIVGVSCFDYTVDCGGEIKYIWGSRLKN